MIPTKLEPSELMWKTWNGEITPLLVASSLADKAAGYHIAHTANELLKDLDLLNSDGKPNQLGRYVISHYLHEKYHRNSNNGVIIVSPLSGTNAIQATLKHDAGAYGRCSFCGRYSMNPRILQEDHSKPCDCGKTHGYSGSFEPPTKDSIWNSK